MISNVTFNPSIAGNFAASGLNQANTNITESTYRLATGDRFFSAGDDVAALSISTRLGSNISGLRQAQSNNTLADTLLQTAYSGLSEIQGILENMQALSTQANSGSLTATERASLDLQFQDYITEIDRLASNTSFNNINLLDGSISGENDIETTTTAATAPSATLTITTNLTATETININGSSFIAGTDFAIGADAAATASNFADALNLSTDRNVSSATYQAIGSSVVITARSAGELAEQFQISDDVAVSTAATDFTVAGEATADANVFTLTGATNNGLTQGGTTVVGTVGDSLVNTLSQDVSEVRFSLTGALADGEFLRIDDGNGSTIDFRARSATTPNPEDFLIGADTEETLQNLVNTIENYTTDSDFVLNQLEFEIDGDALVIRGQQSGDILDQDGVAATVTTTAANGAVAGALTSGTDTGINTSGVVNDDFIGTISGFSATFNGADDITASLTVGSSTYTAEINDTTPATDTFVRFNSADGGYFDVELSGGNGTTVANQDDANTFASRLNAAFSDLTVYQSREVSNFTAAGQLAGGSARFSTDDFSQPQLDSVSVSASSGALEATIEFDIDGEIFRNSSLGDNLGQSETIRLTSTTDSNRFIELSTGTAAIDLSTGSDAATFEDSLRSAFNLGTASAEGGISFQIGFGSSDAITIGIDSATSNTLFSGATPDLTSQSNAAAAFDTIGTALDRVNGSIAEVGSAQSRLSYAFDATESTLAQLEVARSALADTDVAAESIAYANAIVQQQAAISVLAQAQALGNNLLGLLDG